MTRTGSMLMLALVSTVTLSVSLLAERPQPPVRDIPAVSPALNNPHLGNAESIRGGMALYRVRCADCHGMDATGYRGPDLTALMSSDVSDERLFHTIRKGVPGTEMPASDDPDDDLLLLIAYLRKLGTVGAVRGGRPATSRTASGCSRRSARAAIASPAVAAGSVRT